MGDRRKCQTYAASPAEPGGLPVMLVARLKPIDRQFSLVSFFGEKLAAAPFGTFATKSAQKRTRLLFPAPGRRHQAKIAGWVNFM